jgi:SM-20-related protein
VSAVLAESSAIDRICAGIVEQGFAVEPNFLPASTIGALGADARQRDAAGGFHAAGIGRDAHRVERSTIRGDRISWLDEADAPPAAQAAWQALSNLRLALNATLFLGLFTFEGHYAIYPRGAFYRPHRDRFRDDDARVLSCVLYLNQDWSPNDGGLLRIHIDGSKRRDVFPIGGTLVCFLSERFLHEVLPATRERLALTGWFRRRTIAV